MSDRYETLSANFASEGVLLVTLDRPASANAINTAMARDLLALFSRLSLDMGETRCVVVTGSGDRAFCAGGDLKERHGMTDAQWREQHVLIERAIATMVDCPMPIIAAVNGAAYGGGCELVLDMDFAFASETARFALTETSLGIIPGAGGTQNLPRAVGLRRAKELIFTARPFDASEALAWGVVNRLCPPDELLPYTLDTARRIAGNAPLAIRQAKRAMQASADLDIRNGLFFEIEAYNRLVPTADRHEGVAAFNERRTPRFRGE